MNFIYNDVEGEILSFLINSRSMLDVFLINKRWNNLLKSTKFWNTFLLLKENLQMLKEDNGDHKNHFLIDKWEYYTKWLRPVNNITLNIGCYVDVLDTINVWTNGIIKNIIIVENNENEQVNYEKKFIIEFLGWDESFNETVSYDKIRPFGTKTLVNKESKYVQIQKLDNYHWVFLKNEGIWNKEKIKFIKNEKGELTVEIYNNFELFKKKDINEKIRPCTNAFTLFFNKQFKGLKNRNLFL